MASDFTGGSWMIHQAQFMLLSHLWTMCLEKPRDFRWHLSEGPDGTCRLWRSKGDDGAVSGRSVKSFQSSKSRPAWVHIPDIRTRRRQGGTRKRQNTDNLRKCYRLKWWKSVYQISALEKSLFHFIIGFNSDMDKKHETVR